MRAIRADCLVLNLCITTLQLERHRCISACARLNRAADLQLPDRAPRGPHERRYAFRNSDRALVMWTVSRLGEYHELQRRALPIERVPVLDREGDVVISCYVQNRNGRRFNAARTVRPGRSGSAVSFREMTPRSRWVPGRCDRPCDWPCALGIAPRRHDLRLNVVQRRE